LKEKQSSRKRIVTRHRKEKKSYKIRGKSEKGSTEKEVIHDEKMINEIHEKI